jgi:hypothetical protein
MEITITAIHSGLLCETVYNGSYYHELYIGYTRREARKSFREYVLEEEAKYFYEERA